MVIGCGNNVMVGVFQWIPIDAMCDVACDGDQCMIQGSCLAFTEVGETVRGV